MVFCNIIGIYDTDTLKGHNPYFSRWFSAMKLGLLDNLSSLCHNPYFSRWFSAITKINTEIWQQELVTILILVDGFLQ